MAGLLRFLLWMGLALGLLLLLLHLTVLRVWRVPVNDPVLEASIAPTLRSGDLIVLWRLTTPAYGDLVICPEPDYPERVIVGRVLGEAGDDIEFDRGMPVVNGKPFKIERLCSPSDFHVIHPDDDSLEVRQHCHWEEVANKLHMTGGLAEGQPRPRTEGRVHVPPGHVYLVSDNRQFPYDSRDYGPVVRDTCRETVVLRLVSRLGWGDTEARMTIVQ